MTKRTRDSGWNRIAGAALLAAVLLWTMPGAARADDPAAPTGTAVAAPTDTTAKSQEKGKAKGKEKSQGKKAAGGKGGTMPGTMPVKPATPPEHVQVQHILIGFSGSVPGKNITRSKDEAKKLAYQILDRARKGEDFGELVRQYTDDSPPGIYGMHASNVAAGPNEYPRDGMVPAFGNVGFNISPGNIGIADFDPKASPYGWHVIKRLK
jgi:hypothetical protein